MDNTATSNKLSRTVARRSGALLAALSLVASGAAADDRDLLRLSQSGSADPYVFVIFDTSASMTWSPACTQADSINDIDPFDGMCTQECTLDDDTCSQLCPSRVPAVEAAAGKGCREYAIADPDDPIEEVGAAIVIDNDSASPSSGWATEDTLPDPKGDDYLADGNTGESHPSGHETVTYDPGAAFAPGVYMISMSYPDSEDLATNVMVDVTHVVGGTNVTETFFMDQSITVESGAGSAFDGWNLIGTFELDATSTSGTVTIRNESADAEVIADAVQWQQITVPPCLDASDLIYRCQQPICPEGDCFVPLNGDDPTSKFYQAKQALYEAIDAVDDVHFGFAPYEQDNPRMHAKHWLYRVREKVPPTDVADQTLPTLGTTALLEVGDDEVFGNFSTATDPTPVGFSFPPLDFHADGWLCRTFFGIADPDPAYDTGLQDQRVGCYSGNAVDVTDAWDLQRGHRIPKLGRSGAFDTAIWYRTNYNSSQTYKVTYSPVSSPTYSFGDDPFAANVTVELCPDGSGCTVQQSLVVYYDLVSDYAAYDNVTLRNPIRQGGFFHSQGNIQALDGPWDYAADRSSCYGLEPNDDTGELAGGSHEMTAAETIDDLWYDYSIKWATIADSRGDDLNLDGTHDGADRQDVYDVGDRVPLDWLTSNADELKRRLAPNDVRGTDPPDFRIATYFENDFETRDTNNDGTDPDNPEARRLRLLNDDSDGDLSDDERPLIPRGATPLGEALADFKVWYAGPDDAADPDSPLAKGWADVAAVLDTDFPCRQKYILLLTDGVDTCHLQCKDPAENVLLAPCTGPVFENDPCAVPGDLLDQEQIRTYVVGFGVPGGSSLDCIADSGGTEAPLLPRNKEELVEALESILTDVQAEQRTFASASIPAVQSTAADKIFLSSFTPVPFDPTALPPANPAPGFWPGRIDAFRAPLPLTSDNRPDVDRKCKAVDMASQDLQSGCHLWEAGQVLCDLVEADERTILYGMENTAGSQIPGAARPGALRELEVPQYLIDNPTDGYDPSHPDFSLVEDLADEFLYTWQWFVYAFGFFDNGDIANLLSTIIDPVTGIKDLPLDFVGQIDACDTDDDGEADGFAMGDIFHASPVAISGPSNFTYFANDQCGPAQRTDIPNNCVPPNDVAVDEDRGYRRYAADHVWRRRMLAAPTNDGQLHVFDTGVRQLVDNDFTTTAGDTVELFNDGSGKELFSYVPRMVMPVLKEQVEGEDHVFSMDGTISVADVFIDPGDSIGASSDEIDRAWRTVLVGGLREGGRVFGSGDPEDFKSGYYALDVTQPDAVSERTTGTDPTLVPCENPGCTESTTPSDEYSPSCLVLDAQGIVAETTDCPFRIDPAPGDAPQFPAELWTFRDSWMIENPSPFLLDDYLEFYLDEDASGENGHGVPDLADTWSRPVITQVAVCPEGGTNCVFGVAPDDDGADSDLDGRDLVTKHVAIFGGGMDPESKQLGDPTVISGAYLYMVDIETGFPIYKKKLCPERDANDDCTVDGAGSAPSDPTVLDVDRDGIADVVYIGTTEGYLYKIKLSTSAGETVPNLVSLGDMDFDITNGQLLRDSNGDGTYNQSWADVDSLDPATSAASTLCGTVDPCAPRVVDSAWSPFPILDTGGSPIYYASSAFLVPERNQFALTVGTGDREDLWSTPYEGGVEGKFFVIVDEGFTASDLHSSGDCVAGGSDPGRLPITESCLVSFPFTADAFDNDVNLLTDVIDDMTILPDGVDVVTEAMRPGWVMSFPTSDPLQNRVTSESFAVSGILVFSVFDPNIVAVPSGDDDDDDDAGGDDDDDDGTRDCGRSGTTRAFVVLASNGAPLVNLSAIGSTGKGLSDDDDDSSGDDDDDDLTARDRYQEIAEFTTAPQVVRRQTPNKPGEGGGKTLQDEIDEQLRSSFRQAVLDHLPRGSRFNEAFEMVIVALRNSTGVNVYASIPIAIYPADWRDQ